MSKLTTRVPLGASWYRITNLVEDGEDVAEIAIYDAIGKYELSASMFLAELGQVTARRISLRLNSPGGEIFDGIAIHNSLRQHPAHVTVHVDGLAASIASVIAMAGDRIVMAPHAQMMIHNARAGEQGEAKDMRRMADLLDRQSENIARIYAERAGGTPKQWATRMDVETWFSDREAVAAGLADEVAQLERQDGDVAVAASFDLSAFKFAGRDHAPGPVVADNSRVSEETGAAPDRAAPVPTPEPKPTPAQTPGWRAPAASAFTVADFKAAIAAVASDAPAVSPPVAVDEPVGADEGDDAEAPAEDTGPALHEVFDGAVASQAAAAAAVPPLAAVDEPEPDDEDEDEAPEEEAAALHEVIREALAAQAAEAPAVSAPEVEEDLPDPPPPPPPAPPDPEPTVTDVWRQLAEVMTAGISLAANQSPAPASRATPTRTPPGPALDGWSFRRAIKEATG